MNDPEIVRTKAELRWLKRFLFERGVRSFLQLTFILFTLIVGALTDRFDDQLSKGVDWLDPCKARKPDRARWIEWMLAEFRSDPQWHGRCHRILLAYPAKDTSVLSSVFKHLKRERDLLDKALAIGIEPYDELDQYLFGQFESGSYLGVPIELIKFLAPDLTLSLQDFESIKKQLLHVAPATSREFVRLASAMAAEIVAQVRLEFCCSESSLTPHQREMRIPYFVENDRKFQYDHPEYVVRVPGQPPILKKKEYMEDVVKNRPRFQ